MTRLFNTLLLQFIIYCNTKWRFAPIWKSFFKKFSHKQLKRYNKLESVNYKKASWLIDCLLPCSHWNLRKHMRMDWKSHTFHYPTWSCRMSLIWYDEWYVLSTKNNTRNQRGQDHIKTVIEELNNICQLVWNGTNFWEMLKTRKNL